MYRWTWFSDLGEWTLWANSSHIWGNDLQSRVSNCLISVLHWTWYLWGRPSTTMPPWKSSRIGTAPIGWCADQVLACGALWVSSPPSMNISAALVGYIHRLRTSAWFFGFCVPFYKSYLSGNTTMCLSGLHCLSPPPPQNWRWGMAARRLYTHKVLPQVVAMIDLQGKQHASLQSELVWSCALMWWYIHTRMCIMKAICAHIHIYIYT